MAGYTIEHNERRCVVALKGDLTAALVPDLQAALKSRLGEGVDEVVFDLGKTAMLDSSGIGLLVDSVSDTISVSPKDIGSPPPNVHGIQSRNLRGVCRSGERLVALLDPGSVLQLDERTTQISPTGQTAYASQSSHR